MASGKPDQEPVYFANVGLEVWKRIFTRSRGATNVFAYMVVSLRSECAFLNWSWTYGTSSNTARDTALHYIFRTALVHLGWPGILHVVCLSRR
jgi:hypothetical protein